MLTPFSAMTVSLLAAKYKGAGVPVPKNPFTGIAGRRARAVSGHIAAAPPTSDMNARLCMWAP